MVAGGPARGQLGVEVSTSTDVIHRGDSFNVDMKIQNPFPEPVDIAGWSWQLPPGLIVGKSPAEDERITLQPGDSWAISFPVSSWRPLWAFGDLRAPETGAQLSSFNIRYKIGGLDHLQNVAVTLNIHASPIEIYLAAFVGGILGSFVKRLTLGPELLVSGVLGLILVLVGLRRKDVQLGVSIEDSLGGLVLGFFVGYLGTPYFESLLPQI